MKRANLILVSACLAGINCRWDGGSCLDKKINNLVSQGKAIPVCPEELGGLSTPRLPSEIWQGNGQGVIKNKTKVIDKEGKAVTVEFIKGAKKVLAIAKKKGIKRAVFKNKSAACGCGLIYDGTFSGKLQKGDGITTALLKENGIEVISHR